MEGKPNPIFQESDGMSRIQKDLKAREEVDGQSKSQCEMFRLATAKSRQISVGIVGAGFAGLRCADVLLQHGFKVTILEARNRLGGRVAQSDYLGHKVDLGPNWIHGTSDNPIMHLAKQTGTQLHAWDEEEAIIGPDGKPLDAEEAEEYGRLLWDDGLIAEAFRYSNTHHDSIDPSRSLYDFFAEKADSLFEAEPADVARRKRETLLLVVSMWGAYIGSPVTKQSLKFFWLEECIEGENPFVAETYCKILDAVAKPARDGAEIRLQTVVRGIESGDGNGNSEQNKPVLVMADGSRHEFDEVVVATPLGWLKRNKQAFKPFLPERLSQAMDSIGYGTLDKVYITFPTAFWDTPQPSAHYSEPDSNDPKGKTPNVTAATMPIQQPKIPNGLSSHYPGFTHWLAPIYAQDTNSQHWDQQGMNLAALQGKCAHPTLLFYIYGDCSKHIASLISTSSSSSEADEKLLSFFQPYYSRLPNYTPVCKPTGVLATAWANDEFAGYGSYANFQTGLKKGSEDIEVMRRGMPERGVWFAGEHTAPFVALGTSTGAYWSGEGVGRRMVDAYGLGK